MELKSDHLAEPVLARFRLLRSIAGMGVGALVIAGCGSDPHKSESFTALNKGRVQVIDAAKKIRNDSRANTRPSENYYGSYRLCKGKGVVHYILETDWITPKGDEDDLRAFSDVGKALEREGWKDYHMPSQRERLMEHGSLEISISVKPGASWITGYISSACYRVADTAGEFLNRKIDHLSE